MNSLANGNDVSGVGGRNAEVSAFAIEQDVYETSEEKEKPTVKAKVPPWFTVK